VHGLVPTSATAHLLRYDRYGGEQGDGYGSRLSDQAPYGRPSSSGEERAPFARPVADDKQPPPPPPPRSASWHEPEPPSERERGRSVTAPPVPAAEDASRENSHYARSERTPPPAGVRDVDRDERSSDRRVESRGPPELRSDAADRWRTTPQQPPLHANGRHPPNDIPLPRREGYSDRRGGFEDRYQADMSLTRVKQQCFVVRLQFHGLSLQFLLPESRWLIAISIDRCKQAPGQLG
jgi:hypothetical protein